MAQAHRRACGGKGGHYAPRAAAHRPYENQGMIHPRNLEHELSNAGAYGTRWGEVSLALAEAWA